MKSVSLFLLLMPLIAIAADPAQPKLSAEAFLTSVQNSDIIGAYDRLFSGSPFPKDKPHDYAHLKSQTQTTMQRFGHVVGFDFIKEEEFGPSIVKLLYALRFEKQPIIWEFYFYMPKESWIVVSVKLDENFSLHNSF